MPTSQTISLPPITSRTISAPRQSSRTIQTQTRPAVLCVDDEMPVLDGIARVLSTRFNVTKVTNGADAIVAVQYGGPYAVVVSDFCLAETDGVQLLSQIREIAPSTVRLLLTGRAAMDDAIAAINEGHIYGFVRKPVRPDVLIQRVTDAVTEHRFLVNERELLEQTLRGSIKALTDLLALTCPVGSGRATRLKRYACDIAAAMRVDPWELEIAAMVSQIGFSTLSPELVDRIDRGADLSSDEQATVDRLPLIAENILATIPRLEGVRAMLRHQLDRYDASPRVTTDPVSIGARILRVAADFDMLQSQGMSIEASVVRLGSAPGVYDPKVIDALAVASSFFGRDLDTIEIPLSDVALGMVFVRELRSPAGMLLIARGQDVTPSLLERVRNHWSAFAARERVRVVQHAGTGAKRSPS